MKRERSDDAMLPVYGELAWLLSGLLEADEAAARDAANLHVRFQIIRKARIENVGKSQSCMVSN